LEDEDLLEMVNAGLIPFTATADLIFNFWKQIFSNIRGMRGSLCSPAQHGLGDP